MSGVIPARFALTLYQGSTFDQTWTLYTSTAQTTAFNLTGYTAAMKVRATFDGAPLISITESGSAPPASDKIVLGGTAGTIRVYLRDETMAALAHTAFTEVTEDGVTRYTGVWDLELTNAGSETFRYFMGTVTFSREVTK